jgi:acyl dehydratase
VSERLAGNPPRHRMSLDWAEIRVGDQITPLEVDVTPTVIVAGAVATRDFMPVHHDRDYAKTQGAPGIFMNILSDTAYCSRFLTDWAGPNAMVRRVAIRLGVPMFPGSKLVYTGTVTSHERRGDEGVVKVEFRATNDLGDHLIGTAELSFPAEPRRRVSSESPVGTHR